MCKWLKIYPWRTALLSDVIAGCTIGFMVVPQSLSYARLGGLPVQYGLYSALTPIYAYACFGSSRQLAVGPVALVNLLLSTGLSRYLYDRNITPETTSNYQDIYNHLTIQISFLVGVVYITMGLLRMGYLTNFLSHAVVSGFTTGAAVIIGASQCKYFVGYHIPNSEVLQEIVRHVGQHLDQFNYKTFILGIVSLGAMIKMKNMGKHNPKMNLVRALGPLTVTFTSIAMEVMFDLSGKGIPIVGLIPRTLPKVTVTEWLPIHDSYDIFMVVFSIAIVGFMESVAIAKKLASQHKYDLDSSMELIGLGMANLTGAIFQSHPVTGSFSRSAVNNEAGAQSGVSGIITATIVLMVLLFLTPVFEKVVSPFHVNVIPFATYLNDNLTSFCGFVR
jgi:sulfate transporter 4